MNPLLVPSVGGIYVFVCLCAALAIWGVVASAHIPPRFLGMRPQGALLSVILCVLSTICFAYIADHTAANCPKYSCVRELMWNHYAGQLAEQAVSRGYGTWKQCGPMTQVFEWKEPPGFENGDRRFVYRLAFEEDAK